MSEMEIPKPGPVPAIPDVKAKDFPRLLRDLIGWQVKLFADLSQELDQLRSQHTAVTHSREFGDVLDRLDNGGRSIMRLVQAAAALGISMEERPEPPAAERLAEVLNGIRDRMGGADGCIACGRPWPEEGTTLVVEDDPEDDAPLADVVAFPVEEDPFDLL